MTKTVRTRFAPSPTGYLHIGGVRTALFCYLFAKKNQGQFILRIDDTDQQRNVDEALQPILDGLKWLGIQWDEGPEVGGPYVPYYQSQRTDKYQKAVDYLLEKGAAYYDFARPEEIQAERDQAVKDKRTFVYSRRWMAADQTQAEAFRAEGRQGVVRLKMPREGKLVIHDLIRGDVEFDWAMEQDHVIQRADGTFIYHLANVVDDEDLKISHVIRAEEHLSNTPRQIFIAQSLGYELPQYAHLPFVAEPGSKTKLSKRKLDKYLKNRDFAKLVEQGKHIADRIGLETTADGFNPVIVDFYQQVGYLPEAIDNYLSLLGWSLDDHSEYFMKDDLIDLFTLERVTKSAASFDPAKLFAFQEKHMNLLPVEEKYKHILPFLQKAGIVALDCENSPTLPAHPEMTSEEVSSLIRKLIPAVGDRLRVFGDFLDFDEFFQPDADFPMEEKAFEKRLKNDPDGRNWLRLFLKELEAVADNDFKAEYLESLMMQFLETHSLKAGQIIHALRVAATGKANGIGMFEALDVLGKTRTLIRLNTVLSKFDD